MNRAELVLATLATAEPNASFSPVQVQKIFFLVDRRASHLVGGPHFRFEPYDYGPFDNAVYDQLEKLAVDYKMVLVGSTGRHKSFSLTALGYATGRQQLTRLAAPTQHFIRDTVTWVRSLGFQQLVAAIYREYPEMKAKSIFNQ